MSASAFAYALILRGAKTANELMALLSSERRAEVQAALEKAKEVPPEDARVQLRQLRDVQIYRQRENVGSRTGLDLNRVSPDLRAWLTRPF